MNFPAIIALIIVILIPFLSFTAFTGAPFVPSKPGDVRKAFTKLYSLSEKDFLIDLGAGDGLVQKIAAEHGASSLGIELNPLFALIAHLRLRKYAARILCRNFYKVSFPPETTVVYVFGDSRDINKIFDKIQREATRLKKPLYVISYAFDSVAYLPVENSGPYFLYKIIPKS